MERAAPLVLLFAGALAFGAPAREEEKEAPPSPRELFLKRCSACHAPGRVFHRTADRDEWREIVERMRRMPQSGISKKDAAIILDYLVSLSGRSADGGAEAHGGRAVYGDAWLSVLETAGVKDGRVRIGGKEYEAVRDGLRVTLRRKGEEHLLSLPSGDGAPRTARVDGWKIGETRYEVHLILYRIRGEHVRIGRALRRTP